MSVGKYRLCLLIIVLVAVVAGAFVYHYHTEQENSYRDGTLVQNEYVIEGELV